MLSEYTVDVIKRNKETNSRTYERQGFTDFCKEHRANLTFLLSDIEKYFIKKFGNRKDWNEETMNSFMSIRRVLLNEANTFERLPFTIRRKGQSLNSMPSDQYVANVLNKLTTKN